MIKQAAILYNGVVFKGDRHRNIIAQNKNIPLHKGEDGFLTSAGMFVNREVAATIARQCCQITSKKKKLVSEDLY